MSRRSLRLDDGLLDRSIPRGSASFSVGGASWRSNRSLFSLQLLLPPHFFCPHFSPVSLLLLILCPRLLSSECPPYLLLSSTLSFTFFRPPPLAGRLVALSSRPPVRSLSSSVLLVKRWSRRSSAAALPLTPPCCPLCWTTLCRSPRWLTPSGVRRLLFFSSSL